MKKVINTLFMFIVIVFATNTVCSQNTTTKPKAKIYSKALTTDPINLINSNRINIKYEQNVGRKNSFTVDLMYNYDYNTNEYTNIGIVLGGGYRWYFHNLFPEIRTRGIEGLAVGPFANINYIRWTVSEGNYKNDFVFDIGAEAVYKFVLFEGLAIEPTLRLGIKGLSSAKYYSQGFILWPGISIGYAW